MAIFSGLTISGGGLTITGAGSAPAATDPYFMYNSLLLPGNGTNNAQNNTFLDGSTNNFTITRNGNTTQGSFSPYGGNWSNYFPSAGSTYLFGGSSTSLALGPGNFTLEGWFYIQALAPSYSTLFDWRTNGSIVATVPVLTDFNNNGKLTFAYGNGSSTAFIQVVESSTTMPVGSWFHMALVRSGTTVTMYFNGTSVGSATSSQDFGLQNFNIGNPQSTNYTPSMYVSNVRLDKGTAVYTANFTPSTTPLTAITNTTLLTCQSPRYVDNSINNIALSATTNVSVQRFSPFDPSSVTPTSYSGYFDGTGDYLSVADNSAFALSNSNFTMETWIYPTATGDYPTIAAQYGTGNSSFFWSLGPTANPTDVYAFFYISGNTFTLQASNAVVLNTWSHHAVVRNSTTLTYYVNGVSVATTSIGSATIIDSTRLFTIGNSGDTTYTAYPFTGYISNFRLVNGTALYTSNFTPSTTPLTAIANTSLLTCQSSTFIDNSTNNFTITASGNSQPTTQNPFGYSSATTEGYTTSTIGGSGYFDGTGDYLNVPANAVFAPTGDFSIMFWCYISPTASGYIHPMGNYTANVTSDWMFEINMPSGTLYVYNSGGATQVNSSGTVKAGQWAHLAMIRSGTTVTAYLNGVNIGTRTQSGTFGSASKVITIGGTGSAGDFLGYISDVTFVSGTALYTSNFVPPSSPLTAVTNTSLLTNMTNAGVYDVAMINDLETIGTAVLSTSVQKFSGSNSMSFPSASSNGAYMKFKTPQSFLFGTGDFTVEMWVNESASNDYALYIGDWSSSTGRSAWGLARTNQLEGPSKLYFFAGTTFTTLSAAWTPTTNTWYHIAVCRSGSSLKLFVDGTQIGSTFTFADAIDNTYGSGSFYINNSNNNGGWGMQGYISNLRVTSGYARYTSNFSVPTEAFPTY